MISKFKLCNVGQGLFYIGDIKCEDGKSFRFIYDCGAEKVSNIRSAIDDYIAESIIIDMLVISHFDKDHISGLELLLKKVKKIKKIFIPYYDDIGSYLLLMIYVYANGMTFDKVEQIVLVNVSEVTKKDLSDGENAVFDFNALDIKDLPEGDRKYRIPNVDVGIIEKSVFLVEEFWKFKFYNTYLKKEEHNTVEIKDRIDKLKKNNCEDLEDILKNNRTELKKIYDDFCSSSCGNSKQNQSSLCLYHGPYKDTHSDIVYSSIICKDKIMKTEICYDVCCNVLPRFCGTILTGDISLRNKDRYKHFLNYYEFEVDKTGLLLLPHHGAGNNWNNLILRDFENARIFLNSSGKGSKFNHPSAKVIKESLMDGRVILCSHESQTVEYKIETKRLFVKCD